MNAPGDLGRQSLVLIGSTWTASALGFLSTVLVARWLGPEALGVLGFGFGLVGGLAAIVLPGFAQAHAKRVAEGRDLGRCVGTMVALQLVCQGAVLVLVLLASPWWPLVIPEGVPGEVILFILLAQVLGNLAGSFTVAFIGRQWALAHAGTLLVGKGLRFLATVAVLLWAPDVRWVAAALLVEGGAELAIGAWILRVRRGVALRAPDRETLRSYWTYARPLLVTNPVGMLQDSLDRVLVAWWAGLAAAGYYQVARALWELLGTLNAYPFQLLFARLSGLFGTRSLGQDAEARRLFASAVDKLLFVAVPAAFGLWAFREVAIRLLYGAPLLPAAASLMVFVVAALCQSALNPYHFVLYALEVHARFVPVVLLRLAIYLAAMAVLVPLWGGPGAAGVRLLLVLFPAWVFIRWTRELASIGFQRVTWVYAAGFATLAALNEGGRGLLALAGAAGPLALAGGLAIALTGYGLVLWLLHPGLGDNLRYARDLAHPSRFVAFLRARPS